MFLHPLPSLLVHNILLLWLYTFYNNVASIRLSSIDAIRIVGDRNNACAYILFTIGDLDSVDEAWGDTNVDRRLGRGVRAIVGTGRLGIEIKTF